MDMTLIIIIIIIIIIITSLIQRKRSVYFSMYGRVGLANGRSLKIMKA